MAQPNKPTLKNTLAIVAICVSYLLLSALLIGFKTEQLILVALFCTCYFLSGVTRRFILGFSVFIVYWIVYDYMKAFPNYRFNKVHIGELYNLEKSIFGFLYQGISTTPNEFWLQNHRTFLDVMCGFFYLSWVPVPLVFAGYLFYKNKQQFFYFSLTFFLVNIIGFAFYYIYPAAPPWYIQQYGLYFKAATPGNTAGLARFDQFFNGGIFKGLYEKNSNVFAAMPSLHSAYPLIVLYYGIKNRLGPVNVFFGIVMLGIWFAAVYTSHHYVLDVLAGILCAISGIAIFRLLATKNNTVKRWLAKAVVAVS